MLRGNFEQEKTEFAMIATAGSRHYDKVQILRYDKLASASLNVALGRMAAATFSSLGK